MGTPADPERWSLYVVRTRDGQLYTGIALDVERRLEDHRAGRGAKYLRGRGPLEVAYRVEVGERGLALRLERRLKRLERTAKETVVSEAPVLEALRARLAGAATG